MLMHMKDFECECCQKWFSSRQSKWLHQKSRCRGQKTDAVDLRNQINDLKSKIALKELESSIQKKKDARIAELEELLKEKGKTRRKPLNYATRMSVWNVTFGEDIAIGQCYCCKRKVTQQDFEAGHVVSVANNGSDHLTNLRVVCRKCNLSMGVQDMTVFRDTHFA